MMISLAGATEVGPSSQTQFDLNHLPLVQVDFFWVVMPGSVVVGYKHFRGPSASVFRVK